MKGNLGVMTILDHFNHLGAYRHQKKDRFPLALRFWGLLSQGAGTLVYRYERKT
jgi:hypothetical protein